MTHTHGAWFDVDLDCKTRDDYFEYLADLYGVEVRLVRVTAELLGPDEDYDGLVSMIQDVGGF